MKPVSNWALPQSQVQGHASRCRDRISNKGKEKASAQSIVEPERAKGLRKIARRRWAAGLEEAFRPADPPLRPLKEEGSAGQPSQRPSSPAHASATLPKSPAAQEASPGYLNAQSNTPIRHEVVPTDTSGPRSRTPPAGSPLVGDSDEPPIIESDYPLISLYLHRPSSLVSTTCAAVSATPLPSADGLPPPFLLSRAEGRESRWRLRRENWPNVGSVWVQGSERRPWPVLRVRVCGWLVGLDFKNMTQDRARVIFSIDDGTAVLGCRLDLSVSSPIPSLVSFKKAKVPAPAILRSAAQEAYAPCRDPRSPSDILSNGSPYEHLAKLADYYLALPLGSTLVVTGRVIEIWRCTARCLEVGSWEILDGQAKGGDENAEAEFRKALAKDRKTYELGFRLDRAWPEKEAFMSEEPRKADDPNKNRRLRLTTVASLPASALTTTLLRAHLLKMLQDRSQAVPLARPEPHRSTTYPWVGAGDEPSVTYAELRADAELYFLAERIAKHEDSLRQAKALILATKERVARASVKAKVKRLLAGSALVGRDAEEVELPESQLKGKVLQRRVDQVFTRVLSKARADGALVVNWQPRTSPVATTATSGNLATPTELFYEETFALPSWRNLGPAALDVLRRFDSAGSKRDMCTRQIVDVLKVDERWTYVLGGDSRRSAAGTEGASLTEGEKILEGVLGILDGLDLVMRVAGGLWRAC